MVHVPLISIIIPIYKVERYLNDCIDSIVHQTYKNLEIILVDDGSPDNCPSICDDYAQTDSRIKVLHKNNEGLSAARNDGLDMAKGKYVVFLDSDDYHSNPQFIEQVVAEIERDGSDVLFFPRSTFYDGKVKEITSSEFPIDILKEKKPYHRLRMLSELDLLDSSACMKIIRREYLKQNNIYFKKGIYSEDIDWFIRLMIPVGSISISNCISYQYRLRGGSISHNVSKKNVEDLFYSIEAHSESCVALDDVNKRIALLNILAYNYSIVLGLTYAYLEKSDRKYIFGRAKQYKWLLKCGSSKKTKLCRLLYQFVGLNILARVLGFYIIKKRAI